MKLLPKQLAVAVAAALLAPAAVLAQSTTTGTATGTAARTTSGMSTASTYEPGSSWSNPLGGFTESNNGRLSSANWYDDRWYITPLIGYTFADKDPRHSGDGDMNYGLAIGKPISPSWNLELRGLWEDLDANGKGPGAYRGTSWKNWSVGLDAQWFFLGRTGYDRWNSIQPYAVVGIGAINDKGTNVLGSKSNTSFMANAGVGFVWPFATWGRLVVDGRYRWDDNSGSQPIGFTNTARFGEWIVTAGLQIPLGTVPAVAAPARVVAPPPPPPPAPPVIVAPPPAPAPVVPMPVPAPAPAPAPAPITRSFDLSADGMFAFDRSELSQVGRSRIDQMIAGMKQAGITDIRDIKIVGHTDPIGADAYNQTLSEARANAVKAYMATQGVNSSVISATGRGESQLKVSEADCRAKGEGKTQATLVRCLAPNRRVEITATGTQARR